MPIRNIILSILHLKNIDLKMKKLFLMKNILISQLVALQKTIQSIRIQLISNLIILEV